MAYTIRLTNESGSLRADVVPLHGGMISQIYFHGRETLRLNPAQLEFAPMAAGGMPLLFPFASKTRDDCYSINGKKYYMPMHGLVKNMPFGVRFVSENEAVLGIQSGINWKQNNYPFDFDLELRYRLCGDSVFLNLAMENQSESPMPFSFGWHPFFLSTDKKQARLTHNTSVRYDYIRCADDKMPILEDLSAAWDDVFIADGAVDFRVMNPVDGYAAHMTSDPNFRVMVLCTNVENSICAEPWLSLPDSVNNGRLLQWAAPGERREFSNEIRYSLPEIQREAK